MELCHLQYRITFVLVFCLPAVVSHFALEMSALAVWGRTG